MAFFDGDLIATLSREFVTSDKKLKFD